MKNMNKEITEKIERVFSGFPNTDASDDAMRAFRQRYRRWNFAKMFRYAAAILIFPMAGLLAYQYFSNAKTTLPTTTLADHPGAIMEYTVNPGVKGRITLPDGSEVWLNSNSTLKTPAEFRDDIRVVELCGEAFFDVCSDEKRPMYVRTNKNITVKVTGTKFNVSTYANNNSFSLHLISGKVQLINENNSKTFDMQPHQEIIVSDANPQFRLKKDPDEHVNTAWKDGYLVFDATPLSEVFRKMERWYGINMEVKSSDILKEKFTAEFKSENLTQVLDFLKFSCGITYLITDEKVILSY
jgi:ferric-dicitrate binding protein FerR (iron transport regulator)